MELELLSTQRERINVVTVHKDFRLWLIVSAEATASLPGKEYPPRLSNQKGEGNSAVLTQHSPSSPAVLTQHCMPVFWDQSLELGRILVDSMELAQQGLYMQHLDQAVPLLLLHGLLLYRQLYGMKLQAHRGLW